MLAKHWGRKHNINIGVESPLRKAESRAVDLPGPPFYLLKGSNDGTSSACLDGGGGALLNVCLRSVTKRIRHLSLMQQNGSRECFIFSSVDNVGMV